MAELICPSVNLLIYDLRNELGQPLEEVQENRDLFSNKLPQNAPPLAWNKDDRYDAEFVELLGERKQVGTLPLGQRDYQGYYYPVRLQDVYGLLFHCTVKDRSVSHSAASPSKIKGILEHFLNQQTGTLGQTWIISACAEGITQTQTLALARECYHSFFQGERWDDNFTGSNRFLGGTLFELEKYDSTLPEHLISSEWETWIAEKQAWNHHVLIAIYPSLEILESSNYLISDWMRIFCYRHKILWDFDQARLFKQLLENDLAKIQKYIEESSLKSSLYRKDELNQKWERLEANILEYGLDLSYFSGKLNAIEIDVHRSIQQASLMAEALASDSSQNSAVFLDRFARNFQENELFILKKESDNLRSGLNLLETAQNLLRGEIELYKMQRDRAFQKTALALGTGLGCGIATAAIGSAPTNDEQQTESALATPVGKVMSQTLSIPPQWVPNAIAGTLSLTVALFVAGGVRLLLAIGSLLKKN